MIKFLVLLFTSLALLECTASSTSTPTPVIPVPKTPQERSQPTSEQVTEPTARAVTSTARVEEQASARPTERPATLPEPSPSTPPAVVFASALFSYPIGIPGKPLGDGFFVRHGTQVENTWYNPGYWHTGEDWYAIEGDTAGARVYTVADGEVVYVGANYPGRVIIVRHADDLYSMYGHLDPDVKVRVDQHVARGTLIGTVLRRGDKTPNHLHFEIRTFLIARQVNGSAPRYGFRCGVQCPPGPGYWPIDAPDLPSDRGWRNPTHVIARRMLQPNSGSGLAQVVVATKPVSQSASLWSSPPGDGEPRAIGELALHPGKRFALIDVRAGAEDTHETSAESYQLWYAIRLADGQSGWVQAAVSSTFETSADGRPSSISFNFYPAVSAAP